MLPPVDSGHVFSGSVMFFPVICTVFCISVFFAGTYSIHCLCEIYSMETWTFFKITVYFFEKYDILLMNNNF